MCGVKKLNEVMNVINININVKVKVNVIIINNFKKKIIVKNLINEI
jgi:hypothetical protein